MRVAPLPVSTEDLAPRARTEIQTARPRVRGKFFWVGDEKLYVKGVTYGTFAEGSEYGTPDQVAADFAMMARRGINAIRTYTPPPIWLLDLAARNGLYVMVGIAWEQHVTFLDDWKRARAIVERVRDAVRCCAGHPAVLCYVVGNEIPASIVRWHGRHRIERFLRTLYRAVKGVDAEALVTYVNFPTTAYLQLPFLDFQAFNVYLEDQDRLSAYLASLQTMAGDKPLIMAEVGLDSRRNGLTRQARTLAWQISTAFASGCAGVFIFAWTDEWHRGGLEVEDWDFGLVTRAREPKPALLSVTRAFDLVPMEILETWPFISVVICTYNGSRYIRECLEHVTRLDYPSYEVIVVNDGSTDNTGEIARAYPVRLITTPNRGLSAARNLGLEAARGEIVAYIDDDAYPDPHWLRYLAWTYTTTGHDAVGGPNIPPPGDGLIADVVANSPGGPMHVLISDDEAEHIPGCNCSFKTETLRAIGGFDPAFRSAGDDVDVCWRLLDAGFTIGFSPSAMVWHHRRNSIKAYLKQQIGYGKAEAMLERKWPDRYNRLGHVSWAGRIYTPHKRIKRSRSRIYHGTWGMAPFQSLYEHAPEDLRDLTRTPEWILVTATLAVLSALSPIWEMFLIAVPIFLLAVLPPVIRGIEAAFQAPGTTDTAPPARKVEFRSLMLLLQLLQPHARLWGRLKEGLTPWRPRARFGMTLPLVKHLDKWSEQWRPVEWWLRRTEDFARAKGIEVVRGGDFDPWDLEVHSGRVGSARALLVIEEHGRGRQMVRLRTWPRASIAPLLGLLLLIAGAAAVFASGRAAESGMLAVAAVVLVMWTAVRSRRAFVALRDAFEQISSDEPDPEGSASDTAAAAEETR